MITEQLIAKLFPRNERAELMAPYWVQYLPAGGIDTPLRVAAYFAQVAHETGNLSRMEENLNYSAQGLANTWPKKFAVSMTKPYKPNDLAKAIARDPVQIGNHAYANRYGNGDVASGDGFKYRGRGPFQITFPENYNAASQAIYGDNRFVMNPSLVAYPEDGVRTSIWYWNKKNLSPLADEMNIDAISRLINGGDNGLDERNKLFVKYCNLLGITINT